MEVVPAHSASGSNLPSLVATAAAPTTQAQAGSASSVGGQVISSAGGAAGALAGWAFASINKQLATSDLQTEMATSPPLPGAFSPANPIARPSSTSSAPAVPSASRPKGTPSSSGMKLSSGSRTLGGGVKKSALDDILGDEDGIADAWGDDAEIGGDLIDVNDDADDWGGFEEAPTPLYPTPAAPLPTSRQAAVPAARSPWDDLAPPVPIQTKPSNGAVAKPKVKPSSAVLVSLPAVTAPTSPAEPSPQVSLSGLSKEEKEKEMMRRREERKARIAALKGGK
jgi:SCY1-like protein 1